jgi:pimeloyl-ACP methyl ester carboxylesterase
VSTTTPTRSNATSADQTPAQPRTRRRLRTWAVRGLAGFLLLVIAAAATSALLELRDTRRFPAPGDLVELPDGRRLHLDIRGEEHDGPTVVLDAGFGAFSPAYAWLHDELADTVTTVAYDRPGYGWSEAADRPVDPAATVDDLHAALAARGLPKPYVIVGHSLGAHYARIFAERHPNDVAGLVLLDPSHEDQFARMPDGEKQMQMAAAMMARAPLLARLGVFRIRNPQAAALTDLPPDAAAQLDALTVTPRHFRGMAEEGQVLLAIAASVPRDLGGMPVHVVSATRPDAGQALEEREMVTDLHRELSSRSPLAVHHEVASATHVTLITDQDHAREVAGIIGSVVDALE